MSVGGDSVIGEYILLSMELIGTVAFAVSGALVAISCSLDLFGVVIVGCTTAVGGGMIRDLLMGKTPPAIFFKPEILLLAVLTTLAVFIFAALNSKRFLNIRQKLEHINIFFDALGLGAFSVAGVEAASEAGLGNNVLLAVTLGVLTGVGGGILRDVFVNEKPYVLTKHIYAVASIVGCIMYYFIGIYLGHQIVATVVSVVFILVFRLLAAHFRWKLPKIKLEETK